MKRLPLAGYASFIALFCAFFFPAYLLGAARGARSSGLWHLYLPWEPAIPLIEWMAIPYLSLFAAYWVPLFALTAVQLGQLTRQSVWTILICGLCFLLFPTTSGFAPVQPEGPFAPLVELIHHVDRPYNLVPSLHVAGAALILLAAADNGSEVRALICWAWLAIMAASTLFVHQHHLIDILAALAVAFAVRRFIPLGPAASA